MEKPSEVHAANRKSMPKPNNIITIPTGPGVEFFKWWCIFLRPFIHLTNREVDVISNFLLQRWELSKKISDPAMIDTLLMSENIKSKIIEDCKITQSHFYVVMSNLRKNNIIINDTLNPRIVPNIRETDNNCFQLLILFKDNGKTA